MTIFEYLKMARADRPTPTIVVEDNGHYSIGLGAGYLEWQMRRYPARREREKRIFGDYTSAEITICQMLREEVA